MPLPPNVDQKIRERFVQILNHAVSISGSREKYYEVKTELLSLMNFISPSSAHFQQLREEINNNKWDDSADSILCGYVRGLKRDYEAGMFDSLSEIIETTVAYNYMKQAELLLGEGTKGQINHIPAAVLAGAVLEDALRRLCQRQTPPINVQKSDGSPKTLDPLIADLQRADVLDKAKADMLKSWAKIRNYAAHGMFEKLKGDDVQAMIEGVKKFLADYL